MDIVVTISVVAGIVGIVGFIYLVFIGQRSIPEILSDRKKQNLVKQKSVEKSSDVPKHNLPQPEYSEFVGRQDEIAKIIELLRPYPESNFHIVSIDGIGGVGKSALALAIGHMYFNLHEIIKDESMFDAIVWVSAKETILTGTEIIPRSHSLHTRDDLFLTIASVFGENITNISRDEERALLINSLLSNNRTLLIIDNFETVKDRTIESFIRELPAPTKVIVTTRHRLDVAYPVRLEGLSSIDSHELIINECKKKNVKLNISQSQKLHKQCGGIPLAIVWSIGLMSIGYEAESVFKKLENAEENIINFCFNASISELDNHPSQQLLWAMSMFVDRASLEAMRYVTRLAETNMEMGDLLAELEKLSLVSRVDEYATMLPLTKQLAVARLREDSNLLALYKLRYINYYVKLVEKILGNDFWGSNINWLNYPTLDNEILNINRAVELAYQERDWPNLLRLIVPLTHYLGTRGLFEERIRQAHLAIEAADKSKQQEISCYMFIAAIGWIHIIRGNWDEATVTIERGRSLARSINFQSGITLANAHLARIAYLQQDYGKAKQLLDDVVELKADDIVQVRVKLMYALLAMANKEWKQAELYLLEATELQYYPWPMLQTVLGNILIEQGRYIEARNAFEQALSVTDKMQKKTDQDAAYFGLARIDAKEGNIKGALKHAEISLRLYQQFGQTSNAILVENFIDEIQHKSWPSLRSPLKILRRIGSNLISNDIIRYI